MFHSSTDLIQGFFSVYLLKSQYNFLIFLWSIPAFAFSTLSTLRPRQNGPHFAEDMFKCIFLNENVWILIEISLKFVSKGSINNNPALFQIMAWRHLGNKPLSKAMMVSSLTHICVTWPQWVNMLNCVIDNKKYIPIWLISWVWLDPSRWNSYLLKRMWVIIETLTCIMDRRQTDDGKTDIVTDRGTCNYSCWCSQSLLVKEVP